MYGSGLAHLFCGHPAALVLVFTLSAGCSKSFEEKMEPESSRNEPAAGSSDNTASSTTRAEDAGSFDTSTNERGPQFASTTVDASTFDEVDEQSQDDGGVGSGSNDAVTSSSGCGECDDGISCTESTCIDGVCSHSINPSSCTATEVCSLLDGGCVATPVCGVDSDCVDDDPCTMAEHCDQALASCRWEVLDTDYDGHPPIRCGGDDSNDTDENVFPGAPELCDGDDNDGDGDVDEEPAASNACPEGTECNSGVCDGSCADPSDVQGIEVALASPAGSFVELCLVTDSTNYDACIQSAESSLSSGCLSCVKAFADCLVQCESWFSCFDTDCRCEEHPCGTACVEEFEQCADIPHPARCFP